MAGIGGPGLQMAGSVGSNPAVAKGRIRTMGQIRGGVSETDCFRQTRVLQQATEILRHFGADVPPLAAPNFGANFPSGGAQESVSGRAVSTSNTAMSGPVSSVLPQQSLQSLPPSRALHPQAPPINFPSLAAPPPLPVFSGVHAQTSGSAACVSGSDLHMNFVGTQSSIPPLPVASVTPVPAAFRGIPSGFSTTNVNSHRNSSAVRNASNSRRVRAQPYESLSIAPATSRLGISGNLIDSLEVLLLPSEAEIYISMGEAADFQGPTLVRSVRSEFRQTRIWHQILTTTLEDRLQNFQRVVRFSNLPLRMLVHDLLSQVQDELTQRGFCFYCPYDPSAPSFSLLQLHQAGRVMNTFNIPSRRLSEYHLTATDTLEHIFYEVEGFKAVSAFSKKQDGTHVLRLAPYLNHLGGSLPDEIQTILNDGLSTPIQIHFCSGAASQAHLIHIHTDEQNDEASLMPTADETSSVSTVDNEINEGLESEVIAVGDASEVQTHRDLSDLSDDSSLFYPSVSAISEFADCIRGLAPDDSSDSHPFLISAATQEDLMEKLKAEIISCYNDDTSCIALDKFARGLSFRIRNSDNTQGIGVVREQHKELAFVRGVIIALSIVHLSRLPHQLCCLSVLYHLGYGKSGLLTKSILAKHHPKPAAALNEFKASGSFTAIEKIAVPYLDIDAAGAAPMIASDEARAVFSHKLLLACVRGPIAMEANDEEVAFSAGLNLHCSNGFRFGKLCEAYADGWEGLLESLDALGIQSFDDLAPTLSFVEPQTAVRLLRQHSEFQSFSSLIEGFLRRTGWPLGDSGNDPLGLANCLFRLGYDDLQSHLNSPGFRSQLLYCCATSSDSLLGGQQIRIVFSDTGNYSIEGLTHNMADSAIRVQTCFGSLAINSSAILYIIHNNPPGNQLAEVDNWLLSTMVISLDSMGGTM
ncbi:uncharacterized protein EI90DRAFT_3018300 [Cantharellus anzutake]|uniref:uncharacterized protein n=1 Tax=Cantharellus anzutake TaxID=1750568 RepID=UPI001907FE9C|nr:uncharacterized protein EI90DRAFT_3018300 [Cantharellus anzutake]KAF8327243.1 hypothetical protein EI90DRAFT_3018300 [Cantharellus anzutake]